MDKKSTDLKLKTVKITKTIIDKCLVTKIYQIDNKGREHVKISFEDHYKHLLQPLNVQVSNSS